MLKNYFILGFRNLLKNKVASSLTLIGLSVAVAFCITIFLFLQATNTNDDFHENGEHIYLIGHQVERFGEMEKWGTSPVPLGPALAADFPQIERVVRYEILGAAVHSNGDAFSESVAFADPGFFDMLTFPLSMGQPSALKDPGAVIISAEMADKYFSEQDPMGQRIDITFQNGAEESFTVQGVAKPFPQTNSLEFGFLLNYEVMAQTGLKSTDNWSDFTDATFVQLTENADISLIADQLAGYVQRQNEANESWQVRSYFFDNVQNPGWNTWQISARAMDAPQLGPTIALGLLAALVLAFACVNYVIISLGSAATRLKEIGIRKTAGAEKKQLVMQFLTENLLLCFAALIFGIVLAVSVIIPLFTTFFTGAQLSLNMMDNSGLWIFLVGLLTFMGLLSGAYPAFYISSFHPVTILKGKTTLAEKKGLTYGLATAQFVLAISTITLCMFFLSLHQVLENLTWGYNAEQTLVIPNLNQKEYTILQNEALQLPQIQQVAGAQIHVGGYPYQVAVQVDGTEKEVILYSVGPSYLETMGIAVNAGNSFEGRTAGEANRIVVINQTFAEEQGWSDPLGQSFRLNDHSYTVIGVVEDFLIDPQYGRFSPSVFVLSEENNQSYMLFRVEDGAQDQVAASLAAIWDRHFPESDFEYFPQTDVFEKYHVSFNELARNIGYLAFYALLVSCMGLFGMASQRAVRRMKEMGIRKVLGATAIQIAVQGNRSFMILLGVASLIATPLCYFGLSTLLSFVPVEVPLGPGPFIIANVLVFLMAMVSLSMQTATLVRTNPAEILRSE